MVEEDRERVKGLKEDLLEEAQRELIKVHCDNLSISYYNFWLLHSSWSFFLKEKANISSLFGVNTSVNTSYASPRPVKPKEPKEKKKSLFAKKEVKEQKSESF